MQTHNCGPQGIRGPPFETEDPNDAWTRVDVIIAMRATCAASLLIKATACATLIQCPLLLPRVYNDNMTDFHETWYERHLACLYTIRTQEWAEQCSITAGPPPSLTPTDRLQLKVNLSMPQAYIERTESPHVLCAPAVPVSGAIGR